MRLTLRVGLGVSEAGRARSGTADMPPGEMAPSRAERRLGESIGERGRLPARLPAALPAAEAV